MMILLEAISKRPLELNIRVGPKRPILEILNVCLRLAVSTRLLVPLIFSGGTF
jgi:hypothetical protein